MVIKQIIVGHMKVFCYILACRKSSEAVIIDPGGKQEKILQVIREMKLQVSYIINSHNHPDHTCGNRRIKEVTGARIVMHEDDFAFMDNEDTANCFIRLDFPVSDSPPADKIVSDGETLTFGNHVLQVIHVPGHSPGGICLSCGNNLFTGDSLFVGAAGRVDLPGADFHTLLESLEKKIAPMPDDTVIWPGHDYGATPSSTIAREKKENPYLGGSW